MCYFCFLLVQHCLQPLSEAMTVKDTRPVGTSSRAHETFKPFKNVLRCVSRPHHHRHEIQFQKNHGATALEDLYFTASNRQRSRPSTVQKY